MARTPITERLLLVAALSTVLGPLFAVLVLGERTAGALAALAAGVLAQLAASLLVARLTSRPHLGLAAVLLVGLLLRAVHSPWQQLQAVQAVPWLPLALAWATVRVLGEARTPRQTQVSVVLVAVYLAAVGVLGDPGAGASGTVVLGAAVPVLGGACASLAHRLHRARRDHAGALAAERAALAYRARVDERQQVAARVHDTLGHVLTLLVLHANALTAAPGTREVGERMSRLGNQGLAELRQILTLFEAPAAPVAPEHPRPRPEDQARTLVAEARAAGQVVHLTVADPFPAVPAATAGALARTVQEGLTNARRHAPGSTVHVVLSCAAGVLRAEVRNDPGNDPGTVAEPGTGRDPAPDRVARRRVRARRHRRRRLRSAGGPARAVHQRIERPVTAAVHVVVVDDEPMVGEFLRGFLSADGQITVDAIAHDGAEGVEAVIRHRPAVVLMDLRMPGVDGIRATAEVRALPDPPAVLAMTTLDTDEHVLAALDAGAAGFILKTTPPERLVPVVLAAAAGASVLSPETLQRLRDRRHRPAAEPPDPRLAALGERDRQVLALVAEGLSNADIAAGLYLSEGTVKGVVSRLMAQLGSSNRTQLALHLLRPRES